MEKTFTILLAGKKEKIQYRKESDTFLKILGYQGKRRQRFTHLYTHEQFITQILFMGLKYNPKERICLEKWHTCRNREMKKILDKSLKIAFEMIEVGSPEQYKNNLKKNVIKIYLKYWNFPTDLVENVFTFLIIPRLLWY